MKFEIPQASLIFFWKDHFCLSRFISSWYLRPLIPKNYIALVAN